MDPLEGDIVLCTNTSDLVVDVVPMQERYLLAYEYRKLKFEEFNFHVHEQWLFVVFYALKVWKYHMLGTNFKIEIEHQFLWYLSTQRNFSGRQQRWMEFLQQFDFNIKYKRKCCSWCIVRPTCGKCNLMYQVMFDVWTLKTHYANDVAFKLLFENLSRKSKSIYGIEQF